MSTLITTLIIRILKGAVPGFVVLSAVILSTGTSAAERLYIFTENYPSYNQAISGKPGLPASCRNVL